APLLLSKFAYVELIDVEGERVMIEKVKMIDGQGQGDFFIPTTLESGYYSLVAYTNYMRNWESSTFYKDQLLVINPYTNNQHVFWKSGVAGMDSGVDSVNNQYVSGYSYSLSNNQNAGLKISTDKLRYGTREKVELTIDSNPDSRGTYSVSIRKSSDLLRYKPKVSPVEYLAHYRSLNSDNITSNIYLPELRGDLFRCQVIGVDGRGVANQKVFVSVPGKQYELKIIPTDGSGDFIFSLDSKNLEPRAIFQVLGTDRTDFDIEILELPELKIG